MNTVDIIQQALTLAERVSPACVPSLLRLQQSTEKECLKIVVLGNFKAGKSTLINSLFLNSPLLPTEYSECTAIPVRIMNGTPELRFGKRDADGKETIISAHHQPSAERIAASVTADTDEARMALAQQYSFAELSLPNILPGGIWLVDTPGLDSPNAALMLHTMWEAHDADAVIYVVRGKTLAATEVRLITELSGSRLHKIPFFIVLTTDDTQPESMVKLIEEQIRAQLHTYGLPIEIGSLSLPCVYKKKKSHREHLRNTLEHVKEWVQMETFIAPNIVQTGKMAFDAMVRYFNEGATEGACPELRATLWQFLSDTVRKGREAKLCRDLLPILTEMQNAISLRLHLSQENQAERDRDKKRLSQRAEEYRHTVDSLMTDIAAAQMHFYEQMQLSLVRTKQLLLDEVNQQERAGDILNRIKSWEVRLPQEVHHDMSVELLNLEKELRKLRDRYQVELEQQMLVGRTPNAEYEAGLLSSVPTWLLTVTDYVLFDIISPLPFFMDMGLRYILGKMGLAAYMPDMLAARLARRIAADKLDEAIKSTETELRKQLQERFSRMNEKLKQELVDNSPFNKVNAEFNETSANSDVQDQELQQASLRIDEWKLLLD